MKIDREELVRQQIEEIKKGRHLGFNFYMQALTDEELEEVEKTGKISIMPVGQVNFSKDVSQFEIMFFANAIKSMADKLIKNAEIDEEEAESFSKCFKSHPGMIEDTKGD